MGDNLRTVERLIDAFTSEDLAVSLAANPHSSAIGIAVSEVAAPGFECSLIASAGAGLRT